jgi:hypothetical protein
MIDAIASLALRITLCGMTSFALAACSPKQSTGSVDGRESNPTLVSLSSELKRLQATRLNYPNDPSLIRLEGMLNLPRQRVIRALGAPTFECANDLVAGCTRAGDAVYSFYVLPEGTLGGGPELSLTFDTSGICVRAEWVHSQ